MKSKSQLKQDNDFLKLQTDKFEQNLNIALGHDRNVMRKEKALETISNAMSIKKSKNASKIIKTRKIKSTIII